MGVCTRTTYARFPLNFTTSVTTPEMTTADDHRTLGANALPARASRRR